MGFIKNVWSGAKSGASSVLNSEGDTLLTKAQDKANAWLAGIKTPMVRTEANVQADKSLFLLIGGGLLAVYFIFKKK